MKVRTVLAVVLLSVISAAQSVDRVWQVRFGAEGDTPLTASNNAGVIEFRNDKGVLFTIPAASITAVFHSSQQIRRSTQAYNFFDSFCCGATDSHLLPALAYLVATPLGTSRSDYVEIDWTSKGPGSVQLRLAEDEYVPFMEWVSRLGNVKARDLDREREDVLRAIDQYADKAIPIEYQGPNGDRYNYQILSVDSGGDSLMYLFRGHGAVKPKNLLSIFSVTEEASDNTCVHDGSGRILGECRGAHCEIKAILTRNYTYRPGTLPRTYTVGADGLSGSECRAVEAEDKAKEENSSAPIRRTLKKRDR